MGLRICLVSPFSWTQPHAVSDHVAGLAAELRRRGHAVTLVVPSGRASDLLEGRRALQSGQVPELLALGPAVPVSRRSTIGVPVGVRANLAYALQRGRFDVVHGFEPGLPSLSYVALLEGESPAVATFFSPERLSYPTRRNHRERLLARVDRLLATSPEVAEAANARFPGDYRLVPLGVDTELFTPGQEERVVVVEKAASGTYARHVLRALRDLPGWSAVLLHASPLLPRTPVPPSLRGRVHVRTALRAEQRATLLSTAAVFVPAPEGSARIRLEAQACGCALAEPPGSTAQPELVTAAVARLAEDEAFRADEGERNRAEALLHGFGALADAVEEVYAELASRPVRHPRGGDPLSDRDWIVADLHMHTSWSHDCSIDPTDLVEHAEEIGLGAIAVTDHNVFGGALEAFRLAAGRDLVVVPGEEVKTDNQGEVIGLFLSEEIPRGMSFADTVAAIRDQNGLVYVPHPFDRMHAIPDPATLHRHRAEIDVLEVYNARLLFEGYNDEALRYARKHGLLMGAGSDAHVLQGVGTGALRMRRFDGPEEFLLSLRTAEVLRRPKSLAYLQGLKWVAQVKEKIR